MLPRHGMSYWLLLPVNGTSCMAVGRNGLHVGAIPCLAVGAGVRVWRGGWGWGVKPSRPTLQLRVGTRPAACMPLPHGLAAPAAIGPTCIKAASQPCHGAPA